MWLIEVLVLIGCVATLGFGIRKFQSIFIKKRIIKLGELLGLSYALEKNKFYQVNYGFLVGEFNTRIVEIRNIEPNENIKVNYSIQVGCYVSNVDFIIAKRPMRNRFRVDFGGEIFDTYYYVYGKEKQKAKIRKCITPSLRKLLLENYSKTIKQVIVEDDFLKIIDIGKWSNLPETVHSNIDFALKIADHLDQKNLPKELNR